MIEPAVMLAESDAAVAARDPTIAGLRILLDDGALTEALSQSMPSLNLLSARADYLRYKPGTNCLARIQLDTERGQLCTYAVAYPGASKFKFRENAPRHGDWVPRPLLLESSIMLYPFPLDRRLTGLSHLFEPAGLRKVLQRTVPALAEDATLQLSTLRYKPERRYVAQLASAGRPTLALKVYSPDAYVRARRAEKTISGLGLCGFAKCIGHSNRQAMLVFEWIEGITLSTSVISAGVVDQALLGQAGVALHRLHAQAGARLPEQPPQIWLQSLHEKAAELVRIANPMLNPLRTVCDIITDRLSCRSVRQSVPIHGDLHLEQFVLGSDGPVLIDFDRARLADPAEDLGSLLADLEFRQIVQPMAHPADQLFHAFIHQYEAAGGTASLDHIYTYAAARLIELAAEPFRKRRHDWLEDTNRLVERARSLIGGSLVRGSGTPPQPSPSTCRNTIDSEAALGLCADEALAAAREALSPRIAGARLRELASYDGKYNDFDLKTVRVTRHKRGRRCLIEYEGISRTTGKPVTLLGKIEAKRRQERHFQRQRMLWCAGFQADSPDRVSVARPWGVVPEWNMWLQEKASGESAWTALQSASGPAVASRIATAVAKLHNSQLPAERIHRLDDEVAILETRLLATAQRLPDFSRRIVRLLEHCQNMASRCPRSTLCPVHRDFYPDQILVNGNDICLVDFDLYCHGDPAVDLGNFRAHLIEHSLRCHGNGAAYAGCDTAFVTEYVRLRPEVSVQMLDAYLLLSLARHVSLCADLPGRLACLPIVLEACENWQALVS